jgi:flagellar motor component MotA
VCFDDAGPHHPRLLPPLLEKLGDSKIVLRQMVTQVLMQLMQLVSPRIVAAQLLAALQHRNWRVRHEVILLITQVKRPL